MLFSSSLTLRKKVWNIGHMTEKTGAIPFFFFDPHRTISAGCELYFRMQSATMSLFNT